MGKRDRERAQRRELIVQTARDLAEAEGWAAVTTRRLAELIEFSQPVLYTHFAGKDAIIAVVADRGFAQLAEELARARAEWPDDPIRAVVGAYLGFADANPAVYDGMFGRGLHFATSDPPASLREAFAELRATVTRYARGTDPTILTEVVWSALHGLVTLTRDGRLSENRQKERLAAIVALVRP
ncbi:MAG TPA: TetR/AcrR family transcriptional regulator [Actinophytocola sp.]|uniref:TetR/AcrR family transcriptional regulator n=1 Tax=Actinophytocola sp. TaxID=1872138 RepID=UPI002F9491CF